jgi:proteasome accessory factor B
MAPRKSERLVNLTIALLVSRRFVGREQIRSIVQGYAGLPDLAFQRTFERDKEELRAMGVPIETGYNEALFDDEPGYRIRRNDFELPAVTLDASERMVLGLAAAVFRDATLARSSQAAVAKLRAAGVEPEPARMAVTAVSAADPAFAPVWEACLSRTAIAFDYRRAGDRRSLDPWRLLSRRGSWYVLGRDHAKDAPRMFKLSRFASEVATLGEPRSYEPPDAAELDRMSASLEPILAGERASVLAIRGEAAPTLRRRGEAMPERSGDLPEGYAAYRVPYDRTDELAGEIRTHGAGVLVIEPGEVRDAVIAGLRAVADRPLSEEVR